MVGMIHIYTGNGKGKTTAAFGLAMRAVGQGMKVCIIQFMKGVEYGEVKSAKSLGISVLQFGRSEFVDIKSPQKEDFENASKALEAAERALTSDIYDLVILDEINVAIYFGLISLDDVVRILKAKKESIEVVLTGRYAPQKLIEMADLVTEMREIKHYYKKGVYARKGIEF